MDIENKQIGDYSFDTERSGFAIAGLHDFTASCLRNQFLWENDLANPLSVSRKNNHVNFQGELRFYGKELEELNKELREAGYGDFTVLTTASSRKNMEKSEEERIVEEGVKLINPQKLVDIVDSKYLQNNEIQKLGGIVPPFHPTWRYAVEGSEAASYFEGHGEGLEFPEDSKTAERRLEKDFEFLDDMPEDINPLIYKPNNETKGRGISFHSLESAREYISDKGISPEDDGILQLALPHPGGAARLIGGDNTFITGSIRHTNKNDIKGLVHTPSWVRTEQMAELGYADKIPLDNLNPSYTEFVEEYSSILRDAADLEDSEGAFLGYDAILIDPSKPEFDSYPDEIIEDLLDERFRTNGSYAVYIEANASPGIKTDAINSNPIQDSKLNLRSYADSLGREEEFVPGDWRKTAVDYISE